MNQKKSHIDPRIIRTRTLLKDALVDLLHEMEIEKISVNRLAERATINRVTFYLHYRDIPDMLEKMADDMVEDISNVVSEASADQAQMEEFDWHVMEHFLKHIAENASFYKIVLGSKRVPLFRDRLLMFFTDLISRGIEKRSDSKIVSSAGVKQDILIWYDASALIGTINAWLHNDMPYTPSFLANQLSLLHH